MQAPAAHLDPLSSRQKTQETKQPFAPTEERRSIKKTLEDLQRKGRRRDYYGLLDTPKNATPSEIRDAYRKRSKEYHPDQFYRKLPEEMSNLLQSVFQQISEAYRVLMDPAQKAEYDARIGNILNPDAVKKSAQHKRKQEAFKKAYQGIVGPRRQKVVLLIKEADADERDGNIKGALSKLKLAKTLDPLSRNLQKRIEDLEAQLPPPEET